MPNHIENPKYLRWVETLPCCHCGTDYGIDAHHIIGVGMGKTGGKADDIQTMPLCRQHHDIVHNQPKLWALSQVKWMLETQHQALLEGVL